ncbi:MAG TPA: hypothetical protein VMR37_03420 [Rhabdochlamydiaceae bacterium]|nr:hypothetical protein [Rhabdochlamydiaceae bacterium]
MEEASKARERVFPTFVPNKYGGEGLTKRELFAAIAMQALASIDCKVMACDAKYVPGTIASNAVKYADALIAELEKVKK